MAGGGKRQLFAFRAPREKVNHCKTAATFTGNSETAELSPLASPHSAEFMETER